MAPKIKAKIETEEDVYAKEIDDAKKRITRFGRSFADLGKAVSALFTAPVALFAAPALAAAAAHRQAANTIRIATGEAGPALAGLVEVYDQVRAGARAGFADTADVVGEFRTRLDLTGADLKDASIAALKVAKAAGEDAKPMADAIAKTMAAWGVSAHDTGATIDRLRSAARSTGGGISALIGQLGQSAPALKLAGFTVDEAAALVVDLEHFGVPADEGLAALSKAVTKIAKEGAPSIRGALISRIAAIRAIKDPSEAARAAADLFGKRAVAVSDAIKRGALDFGRIASATAMPSPAPVVRLSRAFADLRIKIEQSLLPMGRAIENVMIPGIQAAARLLGDVVDAIGVVTAWFGNLPGWVKTTIVVIAGVAAIVGPALLFAGTIVELGSALVTRFLTMQFLGFDALSATLGALATGAAAGAALGFRRMFAAMAGAGGPGVPAAVAGVGLAIAGAMGDAQQSAGVVVLRGKGALAPAAAAAKVGKLPPIPALPEFKPPAPQAFNATPPGMPKITDPGAGGTFQAPADPQTSWSAAYDWAKQFADKMAATAAALASTAINLPLYSDQRTGPAHSGGGVSADDLKLLKQIGQLKGVTFDTSPANAASELARARAMLSPGDSMRLHAQDMVGLYAQLKDQGHIGDAFLPGSWLDANSSAAWLQRADEMDRLVGLEHERTQYFVDLRKANDSYWIGQYDANQFALKLAFAKPQVYIEQDVFNAVQQGWQVAQKIIGGGSSGGGGFGISNPPPPPPKPAPKAAAPAPAPAAAPPPTFKAGLGKKAAVPVSRKETPAETLQKMTAMRGVVADMIRRGWDATSIVEQLPPGPVTKSSLKPEDKLEALFPGILAGVSSAAPARAPAAGGGAVQAARYSGVINDNRGSWPAGTPLTADGTPIVLNSQRASIAPEAWDSVVWASSITPPAAGGGAR